jgi:arsenical resistance protein ArsH
MFTIQNKSSVAKAYEQLDDDGQMKPSAYYDRIVDAMVELVKFTLRARGTSSYLTDRYSERKEAAQKLAERCV